MSGIIIAAPSSGSGKTTITLGLLWALRNRGIPIRGAKSGPDYIDPRFHEAATGQDCFNLDAWAMPPRQIEALASGDDMLVIEGAMGLFDGAPPDGRGATADLARQLNLPVILVIGAARMAQSIGAVVKGFASYDPQINIAGVILNKVGSARHEAMLREVLDLPVLGAIPRQPGLNLPSRHLGLVQAQEHGDLDQFLDRAAAVMEDHIDLDAFCAMSRPLQRVSAPVVAPQAGKNIAIARDAAFSFTYPHLLRGWRDAGHTIHWFSPLADEPVPPADFVYLPGGYPELHASKLSNASNFIDTLRKASQGTVIYGECGGFMALGTALTDADGQRHEMAGLLDLETSFAERKLSLGYRDVVASHPVFKGRFKAHEFHYATVLHAAGTPLFDAKDAEGTALPPMGLINGNVAGSFAHVIAPCLPFLG